MLFTMKMERDEVGGGKQTCTTHIFFLKWKILVCSLLLASDSTHYSGNGSFNLANSYHVVYLYAFTKFLALGVVSRRWSCK